MTTKTTPITDDQIMALRAEAASSGDTAQVTLCDRALDGDDSARTQCQDAIDSARAMDDSDATPIRYSTYGSVRGFGPLRDSRKSAEGDLTHDRIACRRRGGYSDRQLVEISGDGYAYHDLASDNWVRGDDGHGIRHPEA